MKGQLGGACCLAMLLVGCRAPGTYLYVARPIQEVRTNISALVEQRQQKERLATNGMTQAPILGYELERILPTNAPPRWPLQADLTLAPPPYGIDPTNILVRHFDPKTSPDVESRTTVARIEDVPGKKFSIIYITPPPVLRSFPGGADQTMIEATRTGSGRTRIRVYCSIGNDERMQSVDRIFRNRYRETETLIRLCHGWGYVPDLR